MGIESKPIVLEKCPNCKKKPEFARSDIRYWSTLLVHREPTCPYKIDIYHYSAEDAANKWRLHVRDIKERKGQC